MELTQISPTSSIRHRYGVPSIRITHTNAAHTHTHAPHTHTHTHRQKESQMHRQYISPQEKFKIQNNRMLVYIKFQKVKHLFITLFIQSKPFFSLLINRWEWSRSHLQAWPVLHPGQWAQRASPLCLLESPHNSDRSWTALLYPEEEHPSLEAWTHTNTVIQHGVGLWEMILP